jgi:hypothetical protein
MIIIFWEMTPCGSYKNQLLVVVRRIHNHGGIAFVSWKHSEQVIAV